MIKMHNIQVNIVVLYLWQYISLGYRERNNSFLYRHGEKEKVYFFSLIIFLKMSAIMEKILTKTIFFKRGNQFLWKNICLCLVLSLPRPRPCRISPLLQPRSSLQTPIKWNVRSTRLQRMMKPMKLWTKLSRARFVFKSFDRRAFSLIHDDHGA